MNDDIVERLRSAVSSRIFPTAAEYAAVVSIEAWDAAAEIERLRARVADLERTLTRTGADLMAAISLLKAGGRDAATSDKMFRQTLNDYEKAVQTAREKLLEAKQ